MRKALIYWGILAGLINSVSLTVLWHAARLNNWTVKVQFNNIGEGWLEGLLAHFAVAVSVLGLGAFLTWKERR